MYKNYRKINKKLLIIIILFIILFISIIYYFYKFKTDKKIDNEIVSLDWYINYSWYETPWGGNIVSKKITEDTNVNVNFIVPVGDETTKLNSMISSNTLPDILTISWADDCIQKLISNDMVYPLNELAEIYEPKFFQVVDKKVLDWYTLDDGNIYGYPNSYFSLEDYENKIVRSNQTFLVRKDIYEAIGSPDMTTPEGFINAVKKAKEMFPVVNGENLIPIGADEFTYYGNNSFDKYLQNFLAIPFEKDNKYYDRYTDKEYIKWLKVFRQLMEEGYLSQEIFLDKRNKIEERFYNGQYFCLLVQGFDFLEQQKKLYYENPERIYLAIDGPKNSNGDTPTLPGGGMNGWTLTMISKNCKNPEKALELITYLISDEGQKTIYLGVEGETYDVVNNKVVLKEEVKRLADKDRYKYNQIYGADNTYWMLQNEVKQKKWYVETNPAANQIIEWTYPYTVYTSQYDIIFKSDSKENMIDKAIKEEWGNTLINLLTSKSEKEFDIILNNFIKKREELGYKFLIEKSTEQMIKNKQKLGIQ